MNYICDCYASSEDGSDWSNRRRFMASVLDSRIAALAENDRAARCQLANEIGKCGISTHRIDSFLRTCEQDEPAAVSLHAVR